VGAKEWGGPAGAVPDLHRGSQQREDEESVSPEGPWINAAFNNGSVVLGSEDGQSFCLLLTTGPRRGEVWMIADVGAVPAPGDQAWGFEEWVRRWHTGDDWWD
jgi:hypothetical protein